MRKMHQRNLAMGLCAMLLLGSTGCSNQGGNTETKQVPQTEKEQAAETTVAGEESSFDWKQFDGTTIRALEFRQGVHTGIYGIDGNKCRVGCAG